MSWTTEISSWKSFSVRYDNSEINRFALKKVYTLAALLTQAEWSSLENGDGVQFHRCGVVFVSDEYYQQELHFEYFLKAPVGTVITASVADDNTSKLGLLTATKLEDGWLLAFTIHPDNDAALSGFDYPKQKRRDHCIKFHLDTLRTDGDFWYQRVDWVLGYAAKKLQALSIPFSEWRRKKVGTRRNSHPRTTFRGQNFHPIHQTRIAKPGSKLIDKIVSEPAFRPKSDSIVIGDNAVISGENASLKEDRSLPSFEADFPKDIRPRRR